MSRVMSLAMPSFSVNTRTLPSSRRAAPERVANQASLRAFEDVAFGVAQDGEHARVELGVDGSDLEALAVEAPGARAAGGQVAVVGGGLAGDAGDGEAHRAGGQVVDAIGARHVVLDAHGADE